MTRRQRNRSLKRKAGQEEGSAPAPLWLGPIGVLFGFILVSVLALLFVPLLVSSALPLLLFIAVPAVSGYAFRALILKTKRAAISSIGTAVGWVLFMAIFVSGLSVGGLVSVLFLFPPLFAPLGWILLVVVALGFILVSQGLASLVVRRVLPRGIFHI